MRERRAILLYTSSTLFTLHLHHFPNLPTPPISSLIPLLIFSDPTTPSPVSDDISTANPNSTSISTAFNPCSAYIGHAPITTPNHTLSRIEFHPQCDINPPVAGALESPPAAPTQSLSRSPPSDPKTPLEQLI
ncbi:unnamed protein product [Citrullus colocynthis]|uniref:Uncharacterized protein n=1 Tax=Citrullus colocynthis TaxID=252529 RepID=A0ABP0YXP9_9ROSI